MTQCHLKIKVLRKIDLFWNMVKKQDKD